MNGESEMNTKLLFFTFVAFMFIGNLFGFPREPVGLSNYKGGIPGGFNRQKIPVNASSNAVTINVGRV